MELDTEETNVQTKSRQATVRKTPKDLLRGTAGDPPHTHTHRFQHEMNGVVCDIGPTVVKCVSEPCHVNVFLNRKHMKVLWDTGAQVSLLNKPWV